MKCVTASLTFSRTTVWFPADV